MKLYKYLTLTFILCSSSAFTIPDQETDYSQVGITSIISLGLYGMYYIYTQINQKDSQVQDLSLFFNAVKDNNSNFVKDFLKLSVDVNATDKEGYNALMHAAFYGHEEIVSLLLNAKANVNKTDKYGRTALMFTAQFSHTKIVQLLIKENADVNAQDCFGFTALMLASQELYDNFAVIKLLVEHNAITDLVAQDGSTAISRARDIGRDELAVCLEKNRACVRIISR